MLKNKFLLKIVFFPILFIFINLRVSQHSPVFIYPFFIKDINTATQKITIENLSDKTIFLEDFLIIREGNLSATLRFKKGIALEIGEELILDATSLALKKRGKNTLLILPIKGKRLVF